jgi:hypothetical protein
MKLNKEGYFVSIGGGVNQIPLIEACLKLGLKVITVDKNPEAPGFSRSHLRIYESVTEYRKIYHSIMTALTPDPILGIGCRSYGHATITTAYLSEKFELPGTPEKIIRKFYNKSLFQSNIK